MALGALAVHQLRYQVAFGEHAHEELAEQGHGYLGSVTPVLGLVAAAALGMFLRRLVLAWRSGEADEDRRVRALALWPAVSFGLVAIFVGQELLEGLLASGHPGGLHGVFGHGGWMAVPNAIAFGGLIALAIGGARRAVRFVASRSPQRRRIGGSDPAPARLAPARVDLPRVAPLATASAGRAPPSALALTVP